MVLFSHKDPTMEGQWFRANVAPAMEALADNLQSLDGEVVVAILLVVISASVSLWLNNEKAATTYDKASKIVLDTAVVGVAESECSTETSSSSFNYEIQPSMDEWEAQGDPKSEEKKKTAKRRWKIAISKVKKTMAARKANRKKRRASLRRSKSFSLSDKFKSFNLRKRKKSLSRRGRSTSFNFSNITDSEDRSEMSV